MPTFSNRVPRFEADLTEWAFIRRCTSVVAGCTPTWASSLVATASKWCPTCGAMTRGPTACRSTTRALTATWIPLATPTRHSTPACCGVHHTLLLSVAMDEVERSWRLEGGWIAF
jgi:hypothetical protein